MTFLFPVKNQQGTAGAMEGRPPAAPPPPTTTKVSMFRRLLVRVTPAERLVGDGGKEIGREKDEQRPPPTATAAGAEAEVGSVGLDKMVISFMEDSSAAGVDPRPPRGRCGSCFNGSNHHDGSISDDEDFGFLPSASHPTAPSPAAGDALELLKGLVQCASTAERNLLADASRIAERCRKGSGTGAGRKKADVRRAVAEGLRALGYDAAVCTSRWEKTPSHPSGEHEYIDAVVVAVDSGSGSGSGAEAEALGLRLVVEVDFRSEFEVARPTKAYRAALQALPPLFVGTPERLRRIVAVVVDAAKQSLRKRGLHFPPWRKHEYMLAKWLSPHDRIGAVGDGGADKAAAAAAVATTAISAATFSGEFELLFDERPKAAADDDDDVPTGGGGEEDKKITVVVSPTPQTKRKVVTGLASLLLLAS